MFHVKLFNVSIHVPNNLTFINFTILQFPQQYKHYICFETDH